MTMVDDDPAQQDAGVAVSGGRVTAILPRSEIDAHRGPETRLVDVGEKPVLPGFVDSHAHAEVACRTSFGTVDVRAPECATVAAVQDRLADAAADGGVEGWVVGQGNLFFDRKLAEGRLPSKRELDHVSRTIPIAIRAGGHVSVLNSAALAKAGIDHDFVPPTHSVTGRPVVEFCTCHHEPTGVVKEMDNLLPFPVEDETSIAAALESQMPRLFTENGVTSVGEISETVDGIRAMDRLAGSGRLPVRMRVYLWSPGTLPIEEGCRWQDRFSLTSGEERVNVQGIKLFADGGFSAASAAVNSPYVHVDHAHRGDIALTEEEVERALGLTGDSRLQLAIHANGDRAQDWLCRVVKHRGGGRTRGGTVRIEHAGNFCPEQQTRDAWEDAGILPAPQPVFIYTFGDYFVDYLGDYGSRGRFPFRSMTDDGWKLSASSDVWVGSEREATNPLFGVWCCVARESYAGRVIDPDQALTVQEALRMHTLGAAEAIGAGASLGSIAPGKLADFAVLERDPVACATADLRRLRVDLTVAGGSLVFERA
ncbi:MAG: amidohydrolase family protein [Actinobacteria bacterium]|nr:amidohydrolase family protein [Actinomycetota bacterium]